MIKKIRYFSYSQFGSFLWQQEQHNVVDEAVESPPLGTGSALPVKSKSKSELIIEKGEENCRHLIEAHKECMRALGFKI
uniref:Cytochrome c oxidase copper chaperone n=1 Tax=Buteo japonicus TaxID=224669 RepID=A0A8C0AXS4_9AVES